MLDKIYFDLRPSKIPNGGVGLFAISNIEKDSILLSKEEEKKDAIDINEEEIPSGLLKLCVSKGNNIWTCPKDFNNLHVFWFINHSFKPNVKFDGENFFATENIKSGEELFMDYNDFNEPEEDRHDYYRRVSS